MTSMLERAETNGLPIHRLDLETDERLGIDPFAVWDEATKVGGLFYSPVNRGYLVAADYDTVKHVLQDPHTWSNLPSSIVYTKQEVILDVPPITMDPPEHTKYRRALAPLFGPKAVAHLEPRISEICHELIDAIVAKGSCDYAKDFAAKLPALFFLEWLGIGTEDVDRMFHLAERATFEFPTQEERDDIESQIDTIVRGAMHDRRTNPQPGDLATAFVNMRVDDEEIPEDLLVGMAKLAFIAGQETTSSQLGFIMWHLARNRADRQFLIDDPTRIPGAIEELMRFYNTGGSAGRVAKQDAEINGFPVKAGDRIFIARCGADRQLAPDVQLTRTGVPHSAFGLGVHRCPGSHVARLEMRIGLEIWHERIGEYRIPDDFVENYRYGSFMQQLHHLPLEFEVASR
ncbi:cytochrome P450 [Rhodococcus sp. T2V]|uniref:cytochrome P450 n=1 Tax=Rhodococcus sp. T2V TaxID=3034164 RepID=UPI0023E24ED2|nr:cytochrome P450 [Rhodococcus sp. T2V]MDF3308600.1 cytochrome P450 [Rhodococcus sp. T2V]